VISYLSLASGYASQRILSWSPHPKIGRVAARASGIKNSLGCMAWLTLALVCVAAAGPLAVIVRGVSERVPVIN